LTDRTDREDKKGSLCGLPFLVSGFS